MQSIEGIAVRLSAKAVVLFATVAVLTACSPKTVAPETLMFADPGNVLGAMVYIAEAKGYFKDEQLTLTYKKFTSGRAALNSVLAGESDVGVAAELPFASDILQGKPLRIIATVFRTSLGDAVVTRRDRGINTAADLAGKRIGLTPNTTSDFLLSVLLREAGHAEDVATAVPFKPEQLADALEKGEVDAVVTWQPHLANVQARFAPDATVLIRTPTYIQLGLLGTQPKMLVEKREALLRLVKALVRAEDFFNQHGAEALQIVIDHLAIKQADGFRQDWPEMKFQARLDSVTVTTLSNEGAWLAKRATPSPAVPDYRAAFAPEFLEAVRPQSVTATKAGEGR